MRVTSFPDEFVLYTIYKTSARRMIDILSGLSNERSDGSAANDRMACDVTSEQTQYRLTMAG